MGSGTVLITENPSNGHQKLLIKRTKKGKEILMYHPIDPQYHLVCSIDPSDYERCSFFLSLSLSFFVLMGYLKAHTPFFSFSLYLFTLLRLWLKYRDLRMKAVNGRSKPHCTVLGRAHSLQNYICLVFDCRTLRKPKSSNDGMMKLDSAWKKLEAAKANLSKLLPQR